MDRITINRIIGQNITARRTGRGMSVTDLAAQADVPRQRVQRQENGTHSLYCGELLRIATLLDCTLDDLYSKDDKED